MSDPCRQESSVATLQATVKAISHTLARMEEGQKKFIEVLERIAEQGQRIVNLEENATRNEKDINALFNRVRALEIAPGEEASGTQRGIIMAFLSAVIAACVGFAAAKLGMH